MATKQELQKAKEQAEKHFKTAAGPTRDVTGHVIGVGIGRKIKDGEDIGCLRFYVEKKRPLHTITDHLRIGERYGDANVPTDVIETGSIVSFCGPAASFRGGPGSSIRLNPGDLPSNVGSSAGGTMGAIVRIGDGYYVLGSNHA